MSIIHRIAESKEMRKNIKITKKMTGKMQFDENMTNVNWKVVRRICDFGYLFMPKEKGVRFKKIDLNGISAVMSIPKITLTNGIVLYIHGGGFVSGSAKGTRGYCSMLANAIGCRVISIDYALAPEHTFPAALNDCYNAYKELLNRFPDSKIAVTGESAGGNLCFALSIRCIKNNIISPACIVAHSGGFDFTGSLERNYEVDDFTVTPGVYTAMENLYSPDHDMSDPEISPYFYDDFKKLPPAVFTCDSKETVKVDSYAMYNKYITAGVEAILYDYENTFHAFAPIGTMAPETTELLKENAEFIRKYID